MTLRPVAAAAAAAKEVPPLPATRSVSNMSPPPVSSPRPSGGHVLCGRVSCNFAEYPMSLGSLVSGIFTVYNATQSSNTHDPKDYTQTGAWAAVTLCCLIGQCLVRKYGDIGLIADRVQAAVDQMGDVVDEEAAAGKGLAKTEGAIAVVVQEEAQAVADVGANTAALTKKIGALEAEGKELAATIASLTEDNTKLQSQLGEIQGVLGKFRDGLALFHQENQDAKKGLGDLANDLAPLLADTNAIQIAVQHLDAEFTRQLQELGGMIVTVKSDSQAILARLREQVECLTASVTGLQTQVGRVGDIEQGLERDVEDMQVLEAKREIAATDLERLRQEYTELQASMVSVLATMKQEREAGEAAGAIQATAAKSMDDSFTGTRDSLKAFRVTLEAAVQTLTRQNDEIKAAMAAAAPASQPPGDP